MFSFPYYLRDDGRKITYLTSIGGAVAAPFAVENFLRLSAVDWMTLEVGAEPTRRIVVKEALRFLKPLSLEARHTSVRQFRVQIVEQLEKESPLIFLSAAFFHSIPFDIKRLTTTPA